MVEAAEVEPVQVAAVDAAHLRGAARIRLAVCDERRPRERQRRRRSSARLPLAERAERDAGSGRCGVGAGVLGRPSQASDSRLLTRGSKSEKIDLRCGCPGGRMKTTRSSWTNDPNFRPATDGDAPAGEQLTPGRPVVQGKFLAAGGRKLWVKGVAYGTFRPNRAGEHFPDPGRVGADFAAMAESGINTVRTYTVPPRWLLDAAADNGLRVLVGVPWEQHVVFLDDRSRTRSIECRMKEGVRSCAGHAAVLGYSVGNEIPAPIVRWHGRRRVERFLGRLYEAAKEEDPDALVTYVNFPSTEYLELPFLDFLAFNVFVEERESFSAYLARLQNVA